MKTKKEILEAGDDLYTVGKELSAAGDDNILIKEMITVLAWVLEEDVSSEHKHRVEAFENILKTGREARNAPNN